MKRKTLSVSAVWVSLLLISTLSLTFNIQPVKSDWTSTETIYIRADGSVEPDTAPISTFDNITYTLTDNIVADVPESASAIVVEKNNIVVDGAGCTLQGTGVYWSTGINLTGRSNVAIKNMSIRAFWFCITLDSSSGNGISGNDITAWNGGFGVVLSSSSGNGVSENNITANNGNGISLGSSSGNSISGNNITANDGNGVFLGSSSGNNISGNKVTANNWMGITLGYSNNNSISGNNIANSKYGINQHSSNNTSISENNITANSDLGVYLEGSCDNSISGNNITANGSVGVLLSYSHNNRAGGNNIADNGDGIGLHSSNNDYISGNNITANNWDGIVLSYYSSGNSVSGNNVTANKQNGIRLDTSSGNNISGNKVTANNWQGIWLSSSSGNSISANNITAHNGYGVYLCYSSDNSISGNTVTANEQGIQIDSSSNNVLRVNSIATNNHNFGVDGGSPLHFVNDIDASNTVDSKPIYYWIGKEDMAVPLDAGYIALVNCTRITVQSQTLANNFQGALLAYTTRSTITRNNIRNNQWGIELLESSNNTVSASNITNNYYGIELWSSKSSNNVVFHNNFVNNTIHDEDSYYVSTNVWDDGYPSGGNYWSDYSGVDEKSGPNQDQLGSDGIGDTPHTIDANNRDRYPLMNPWSPHEHELSASITVPASTKLGSSSFLNATVTNLGINDETDVELVILINGTIRDSTTISPLRAESSYTLTYQWNPTAAGTYNVTAYASPISGEENEENNQATAFMTVYTPPPPVAFFTYSPTTPIASKTVTFDASASYDPDGSITSYDWKFGDGTTGSGKTVTHAYADAGAYTVTLTVTDNEDATDTETSTITILIAPKVGVKAGDWIKIDYTISGAPSGSPLPQWLKVEFLSVEGTSATVRVTMHMSDGTEPNQTMTVDVVAGNGTFQGLSGFVIPANCTTGDSVHMSGYGNITIEGETMRTYVGASRTVVYASVSQYGTQLTYYWDKQTGTMLEATTISGSMTASGKATETNMWQAQTQLEAFPIWIIGVAVAAMVLAAATILFLRKRKQPAEPTV